MKESICAWILAVAVTALGTACGGGVEGEPLLGTGATGDFGGEAFAPEFGFSHDLDGNNTLDAVVRIFLGTDPINCDDDFMGSPRNGTYVVVYLPSTDVGTYASGSFFDFTRVSGGDLSGGGSSAGTAEITASSAESLALTFSYDATIGDTHYALSGDVSVLRCPE